MFQSRINDPKLGVPGYVKKKTGGLQSSCTFYNHLAEKEKEKNEVNLAGCRMTELTFYLFYHICFSPLSFILKEPKCCPTLISDMAFDQSGFDILKRKKKKKMLIIS